MKTLKIRSQYSSSGLSRVAPEGGGGRLGHQLQHVGRLALQVVELLVDDAADAVPGARAAGRCGRASGLPG